MNFKELIGDDRAVSPVIGVILMVAITVILAAVIGSFVLGLGNSVQQTTPNANFNFDYEQGSGSDYNVTATHQGGTTLDSDNSGSVSLNATTGGSTAFSLPVTAGSSATINGTGGAGAVPPSTTVRVLWTSPNGETSQALATGETPS
ncbi:type IV pilin N-terminal domain-containing protein (plasmid) [Halobaculum sp. CBA1158]|uniref:type IV pilin n=1 Tax=Halobaculum sp. CBA1158 TaxID=2904243 RepID=UPI001F2FA257|nr:type IV pilin N-terminal domain-containing protein [Halobaculum sp. CBA1158]UIP01542.1 type IV pilin N-terminal domain-containing protein [Halobaculum sp. CBA1158]